MLHLHRVVDTVADGDGVAIQRAARGDRPDLGERLDGGTTSQKQ